MATVGIRDVQTKVSIDADDLSDLAGNDAAANVDDGRNEPSPHCLHEETIVSTRRLDHFRGFTGVERERLLAHDVFAGVERGHRHIVVFAVRRRDIDDVDVRVSAEISV